MSIYETASSITVIPTGQDLVPHGMAYGRASKCVVTQPPIKAAMALQQVRAIPGSVFLKNGRDLVRVMFDNIMFLQADGNYVELYLQKGRIVLRSSMAEVLRAMPGGFLVPVNRAQAVNILLIETISCDEVMLGRYGFTLSRLYRDTLIAQLRIVAER